MLSSGCKGNFRELLFVFLMLLTSDSRLSNADWVCTKLYALLFEVHMKNRPFWVEDQRKVEFVNLYLIALYWAC